MLFMQGLFHDWTSLFSLGFVRIQAQDIIRTQIMQVLRELLRNKNGICCSSFTICVDGQNFSK